MRVKKLSTHSNQEPYPAKVYLGFCNIKLVHTLTCGWKEAVGVESLVEKKNDLARS